jgi:DNA repair protein RadC
VPCPASSPYHDPLAVKAHAPLGRAEREPLTAALARGSPCLAGKSLALETEAITMKSEYTLMIAETDGAYRTATGDEILAAAREHLSRKVRRGITLSSPRTTKDYLSLKLGDLQHEVFAILFLDRRNRLICYREMFRGTIDGSTVHPREVVKEALAQNAAGVIFAHPHPSGVASPSAADEAITARLKEALSLIDVRVLDHIVIAGGEAVSFVESGLL